MEIRLNKYLSDAGICSRREADRMAQKGRVTIDGRPAVPGQKIEEGQTVAVDGAPVTGRPQKVVLAVNKPAGVVCTTSENDRAPNIVELVSYPLRLYPVGRLDKDSEGLLLMTNDGALMDLLLRASNGHEREYQVEIDHPVTIEFLRGMAAGVPILDTVTRPCTVEKTGKNSFRILLTQGLNRQIRRMCEHFGCRVLRLRRVRIANIRLGSLPQGTWRELTADEERELRRRLEKRKKHAISADNRRQNAGGQEGSKRHTEKPDFYRQNTENPNAKKQISQKQESKKK